MRSDNVRILPRQADVSSFYNNSSVVLNLSDSRLFVETFGLTALEAMSAGLPVIVPTVGGIAEMVEDGVNGYKIDARNMDELAGKLEEMLADRDLYVSLSNNALCLSHRYDTRQMVDDVLDIICR